MGKSIGQIGKHRICLGTPNEAAIKDRVQQVKDAWNASVKKHKSQDSSASSSNGAAKRLAEDDASSPSVTKKIKTDSDQNGKKTSSFSSLLKKVSGSDSAA